jgi:hypothetical protein
VRQVGQATCEKCHGRGGAISRSNQQEKAWQYGPVFSIYLPRAEDLRF